MGAFFCGLFVSRAFYNKRTNSRKKNKVRNEKKRRSLKEYRKRFRAIHISSSFAQTDLTKAEEYTVDFFCVPFVIIVAFCPCNSVSINFHAIILCARAFCLHTGCCCCFWWCVPMLLNERRAHAHTLMAQRARTILLYYFTISSWPYNALRMQLMVIFFSSSSSSSSTPFSSRSLASPCLAFR